MTSSTKKDASDGSDRNVNTTAKTGREGQNRLPHERDESPDGTTSTASGEDSSARGIIKQAKSDVERGLEDTDLRNQRGIEKPAGAPVKSAKPHPERNNRSAAKTRS